MRARPTSQLVEGWGGVIHALPASSAYDDYFLVQGAEAQYGISSTLPAVEAMIRSYRDTGAVVRVWGVLDWQIDDYGGARIVVTRIEPVR